MPFPPFTTFAKASWHASKIVLVGAIALFASLVAFGNLTDYNTNFVFVQHVLSMDTVFPFSTIKYRAITSPSNVAECQHRGLTNRAYLTQSCRFRSCRHKTSWDPRRRCSPGEHRLTSIDPYWRAGDMARAVGDEEQHQLGAVLGPAGCAVSERDLAGREFHRLGGLIDIASEGVFIALDRSAPYRRQGNPPRTAGASASIYPSRPPGCPAHCDRPSAQLDSRPASHH